MEFNIVQWIVGGLCTIIVTLVGFIVNSFSNALSRQETRLDEISTTLGEAQNRISFIEGVVGEKLN